MGLLSRLTKTVFDERTISNAREGLTETMMHVCAHNSNKSFEINKSVSRVVGLNAGFAETQKVARLAIESDTDFLERCEVHT